MTEYTYRLRIALVIIISVMLIGCDTISSETATCIYYVSSEWEYDGPTSIRYFNTLEGVAHELTTLEGPVFYWDIALSGDLTQVAYSPSGEYSREIRLRNVQSLDDTLLTMLDGQFHASYLQWSPDSNLLAFEQTPVGNLAVLDVNSRQLEFLTAYDSMSPSVANEIAWSPDGRQIVFSLANGFYLDLYVINRDGSNLTAITTSQSLDYERKKDTNPAWAPNGDLLAFVRTTPSDSDIWTYDFSTGDLTNLTEMLETSPEYYRRRTPTWSLDGFNIAFLVDDDPLEGEPSADLYVMSSDVEEFEYLTTLEGYAVYLLEWSACPD